MTEQPKRSRGRPKGTTKNETRSLIIHGAVSTLLSWGYAREAAAELVRIILADDLKGWRRQLLGRVTVLGPLGTGRTLKFNLPDGEEEFDEDVAVYGLALSLRHRLVSEGLGAVQHLSRKSIERAYDNHQAMIAPPMRWECPHCGHVNEDNPARGLSFLPGDPCRGLLPNGERCGESTFAIGLDETPAADGWRPRISLGRDSEK